LIMAQNTIQSTDGFYLSAQKNGIYNSRTTLDGGITQISANAPIVQMHERDITGLCTPPGTQDAGSDFANPIVSEVVVPVYLAYDDVRSATAAAAGMDFNARAGSEIALAMDVPGTLRMAWLCHRKTNFYVSAAGTKNGSTATSLAAPDSLGAVIEHMLDYQMYTKADGLFSALHSMPAIRYVSKDIKSVEVTKLRIPGDIRPLVVTTPAPDKATNGSTIYPPGKYIVLFGFASMRCRNFAPISNGISALQGWSFWLKVLVKVVVYALEVAAAAGTLAPFPDSTPALWTAASNLDPNFIEQANPDAQSLEVLRALFSNQFSSKVVSSANTAKKRKLKKV